MHLLLCFVRSAKCITAFRHRILLARFIGILIMMIRSGDGVSAVIRKVKTFHRSESRIPILLHQAAQVAQPAPKLRGLSSKSQVSSLAITRDGGPGRALTHAGSPNAFECRLGPLFRTREGSPTSMFAAIQTIHPSCSASNRGGTDAIGRPSHPWFHAPRNISRHPSV